MSDATRTNVSAWARRFNVKVNNYERACQVADTVYNGPSRRGAIFVVALKVVSVKFDLPMGDAVTRCAAAVVTHVVYNLAYSDADGLNGHLLAREVMTTLAKTETFETSFSVGVLLNSLVELGMDAIYVRSTEHHRPSIANLVLAKVKR